MNFSACSSTFHHSVVQMLHVQNTDTFIPAIRDSEPTISSQFLSVCLSPSFFNTLP